MSMIYDFCLQYKLSECLVLGQRHFDPVVRNLWRVAECVTRQGPDFVKHMLCGITDGLSYL